MDVTKFAQIAIILLVVLFVIVDIIILRMVYRIIRLHNATVQILRVETKLNEKYELDIEKLQATLNFFYSLFTDIVNDPHEGSIMYKIATLRAILTMSEMKAGMRPFDKDIWNIIKNPKVETVVHNMRVMLDPKKYNGINVLNPETKSAYDSFMKVVDSIDQDLSLATADLEDAQGDALVAVIETVGREETDDKFTDRLKDFIETQDQVMQNMHNLVNTGDDEVQVLVNPADIDVKA